MTNTEFNYVTYIKSTPQKVWDAITNPEFTRQYWGEHTNVSDWKVGSPWQHVDTASGQIRVAGEVVECTPPSRLVFTWVSQADATDVSRVTFDIEETADMVCLTVRHDQLRSDTDMGKNISLGWPRVLSSLKSFLETGAPIDIMKMKGCGAQAA